MSAASCDIPLFVLHGRRLWREGELSTISSPGNPCLNSRPRTSTRFPWGMTGGGFLIQLLTSRSQLLLVTRQRILRPSPPRTAFLVPARGFPVDSRCRQRSIALNHISRLPIPHRLEYHSAPGCTWLSSISCWRPEGDLFHVSQLLLTCEPTCTQAIDLGTSGPTLTPADTSRPSWSSGHFLHFRGQAPHGGSMVHHSMATGFPIPRSCCLALSAFFACSDSFATQRYPVSLCLILSPAQSPRPTVSCSLGAVVLPFPHSFPGPVPSSHPSSRVYTPTGCQQPSGARPQHPHPSGDRFVLLARVAPLPSPCPALMVRSLDQSRMILSGASGHISHVEALLAYLCIGTNTQRLFAAVAQQGRQYTYPNQGLEG